MVEAGDLEPVLYLNALKSGSSRVRYNRAASRTSGFGPRIGSIWRGDDVGADDGRGVEDFAG